MSDQVPEDAVRGKHGGWIKPFTAQTARDIGKTRNRWKPPPNPETGNGAVWYRKQHALALARLKDRQSADAVRLAEDQIIAELMVFLGQQLICPTEYQCIRCGARTDNTSRLMAIGAARLGRVHQRCMTPLLDDLERRAREIWTRLATSPRRSPP